MISFLESARVRTLLAYAVILTVLVGAAFVAGAGLTVKDQFPVPSIGRKVVRLIEGPPKEAGREIETTLVGLRIDSTLEAPPAAQPQGGGLTSFGSDVLVLNNDGVILVSRGDVLSKASFAAPNNGLKEYLAAADRLEAQGYRFYRNRLRYNDIAYVSDGDRHALLVSFIEWHDERLCYTNTVSIGELPTGPSTSPSLPQNLKWQTLFRTTPCLPLKRESAALEGHMAGGKIVDLGGGKIGYTSGDFHWDGATGPIHPSRDSKVPLAQDPAADYGKVLVIDWRSGRKTTLSSGNRNMQGIAATSDGRIWTVEHGPRGGDELNLNRPGQNNGWPLRTYGTQYNLLPHPNAEPFGRHDGFTAPAFAWVPSIGVSGLTVIRGFDPAWDGDLLAASLREGSLYRIRIEGDRGVYSEKIPIGRRIRDVEQHTDGRIVLWTDDDRLVFISRQRFGLGYEAAILAINESALSDESKRGLREAIRACAECHSFSPGVSTAAPTLANLIGRPIGRTGFPGQSEALSTAGGVWTKESLDAFLRDPSSFAKGTSMPNPQLSEATRRNMVDLFNRLSRRVE